MADRASHFKRFGPRWRLGVHLVDLQHLQISITEDSAKTVLGTQKRSRPALGHLAVAPARRLAPGQSEREQPGGRRKRGHKDGPQADSRR